jgi:hypothetical protein
MPTVLRVGGYRFFFYANDREEPPHVHVEKEDKIAKFWLDPLRFQNSGGFNRFELRQARRIIEENNQKLIEAWHEYFGH